jgi:hypothetical protein
MVLMHHRVWAILVGIAAGFGAFVLGTYIQNTIARNVLFGIAIVALASVMATGMTIGPMDDWQHRHGSCLLDTIDEMRKR